MKKLNLAVIFGGQSGEHEVSVHSARQVIAALDKNEYNVIPIAITKQGIWLVGSKAQIYLKITKNAPYTTGGITKKISSKIITINEQDTGLTNYIEGENVKIDLVLPIGHGTDMEDGKLQGMLDLLKIPYVFSGVLASAIAMNKKKTKLIAKDAGLSVLPDIEIEKGEAYELDKIISHLNFPIVVKPLEMGSSVGITIAKNKQKLVNGVREAFKYDDKIMLEKFAKGRELTVSVIGTRNPSPLPVVEIIPKVSGWFDYEAKYMKGASDEICPAEISDSIRGKVQRDAVKIYKALDCRDLARADFIWDEENDIIYFLEINTIPGMTATSLAPQAAKAAGMNFTEFLDKLITTTSGRT